MVRVVSVRPLSGLRLHIRLSNGRSGTFSIEPYIQSDFFRQLLDESYFRKVSLFFQGIGWPNGQDLGPDTIEAELCSDNPAVRKRVRKKTRALAAAGS